MGAAKNNGVGPGPSGPYGPRRDLPGKISQPRCPRPILINIYIYIYSYIVSYINPQYIVSYIDPPYISYNHPYIAIKIYSNIAMLAGKRLTITIIQSFINSQYKIPYKIMGHAVAGA